MKRVFVSIIFVLLQSMLYAATLTYEEALAQVMSGNVKWDKKVFLKDFTAENYSQMDSVKGTNIAAPCYDFRLFSNCNTKISEKSDTAKSWATFCCSGTYK